MGKIPDQGERRRRESSPPAQAWPYHVATATAQVRLRHVATASAQARPDRVATAPEPARPRHVATAQAHAGPRDHIHGPLPPLAVPSRK